MLFILNNQKALDTSQKGVVILKGVIFNKLFLLVCIDGALSFTQVTIWTTQPILHKYTLIMLDTTTESHVVTS